MDLLTAMLKKITILTSKTGDFSTKWKASVHIPMPGGMPLEMAPTEGEQNSMIESLEALVERLRKAVEEQEILDIKAAMEAREKAFGG